MRLPQLLTHLCLVFTLTGCGSGGPPEPAAAPEVGELPAKNPRVTRLEEIARGMDGYDKADTEFSDTDDLPAFEWNDKLTALRKIRAGMTIEQVEDILGIADETDDDNDPSGVLAERGETLTILTWRGDEDGDAIIIGFGNERLKDTSYIKVTSAKK